MNRSEEFIKHVNESQLTMARDVFKRCATATQSCTLNKQRAVCIFFEDGSSVFLAASTWAWVRGW